MAIEEIVFGAGAINKAGFALLIVFSLYMLFAYGGAMRISGSDSFGRLTGIVYTIVKGDVRVVVGGIAAVLIGAFGWTLGIINLGAAFAGLFELVSPVWFWFASMVMGATNVLGLSDVGILELFAIAAGIAVVAALLRAYTDS